MVLEVSPPSAPPILSRKQWGLIFALALLIHILIFVIPWGDILPRHSFSSAPPIQIHKVDPALLEQIKNRNRAQQLLLSKKQKPSETAPENARYFSDRNVRVQEEMRARSTQVIPKPGSASPPQEKTKTKPESRNETLPRLSDLGVPMPLQKPRAKKEKSPTQNPSMAPGGDQAIQDTKLKEGAENLLNTQENKYYGYYSRLYEAIAPLWESRIRETSYSRRVLPGEYQSQVDVVFDKNGFLQNIDFLHRSGIPEFDNAIVYSWKKIARFPNPPSDLLGPDGLIHTGWTFNVHVGEGAQFQYAPPERQY